MNPRTLPDERGSLPLVLLAAIVLGGVVAVLFGAVSTSVESTRRDRDFAAAIQVADAGLQQAFVELQAIDVELLDPADRRPACDPTGTGVCSGTLKDGSEYAWSYVQGAADRVWQVTSVGSRGETVRTVQAMVGERALFPAAVVAKSEFNYNGGAGNPPPFAVGGFDEMNFTGVNTGANISTLFLYGDDNEPTGNHAPSSDRWERTRGPDLPNIAEEEFAPGGVCHEQSDALGPELVHGQVYCLTGGADFNVNTAITGDPAAGAVQIYVQSGGLTLGPRTVNGAGTAADLEIYVGAGSVTLSGNFTMKAAIYAPTSACSSNGQGGGGFEGAMICNTVTLNGNWRYDPTVGAITDDTFAISGWSEEPGLRL